MSVFVPPGNHRSNAAAAAAGLRPFYSTREGLRLGQAAGGYLPLVAQDYSNATIGGAPEEDWRHSEIVESPSFSGNRSARLGRNMALGDPVDPNQCGGSFYGRRVSMPLVPLGKSVWQRFRVYFPSNFSWGFAYGANESDNPCGRPTDGTSTSLKFLVFSPNIGTARIYLNLDCPRRQIGQKANPGIRILMEGGANPIANNLVIPEDQWVSFQLGIKVSNTGDGWARLWVDDQLLCEGVNINTVASQATGLNEWGIGDYWNGVPWTDGGEGREHFYVDDIIVAADIDGYGAPTSFDSFGNKYISPMVSVNQISGA